MLFGRTSSVLIAGLCLAIAGCQNNPGLKEREDLRDAWQRSDIEGSNTVERPSSVALIRGPAPLVYQMPQSGVAHIYDSTSGAQLASMPVSRGAIVDVDPDNGVTANGRRLWPGPLSPGHEYTISLDLQRAEAWQSGVEAPTRPTPIAPSDPASRPSEQ